MTPLRKCACGCGQDVTSPVRNQKYLPGHRIMPLDARQSMTYEIFLQHKDEIVKRFYDSLVPCGLPSIVKACNGKCLTLKPRRGSIRTHKDKYIATTFTFDNVPYVITMHTLAAWIKYGPSNGLWALHKCDVKMCSNPDHVYYGTQAENSLDYCNRRQIIHNNHNLSRDEINSILFYLELGWHTEPELAEHFNCALGTIQNYSQGRVTLTTDGSEVLPDDWKPIDIPISKKETYVNRVVLIGKQIEMLKRVSDKTYREIYKSFNLSIDRGDYYRKIANHRDKIHDRYFQTMGVSKIVKLLFKKTDLSKY